MVLNATMVTFLMTLLMNKFTITVMDDGWVHPLAKTPPSHVSHLWWHMSWMVEFWMKNHLVSNSNCNTVNLRSPKKFYKEWQIMLGWHLVLVTLYRGLQWARQLELVTRISYLVWTFWNYIIRAAHGVRYLGQLLSWFSLQSDMQTKRASWWKNHFLKKVHHHVDEL